VPQVYEHPQNTLLVKLINGNLDLLAVHRDTVGAAGDSAGERPPPPPLRQLHCAALLQLRLRLRLRMQMHLTTVWRGCQILSVCPAAAEAAPVLLALCCRCCPCCRGHRAGAAGALAAAVARLAELAQRPGGLHRW
jgi:hypothetical protein